MIFWKQKSRGSSTNQGLVLVFRSVQTLSLFSTRLLPWKSGEPVLLPCKVMLLNCRLQRADVTHRPLQYTQVPPWRTRPKCFLYFQCQYDTDFLHEYPAQTIQKPGPILCWWSLHIDALDYVAKGVVVWHKHNYTLQYLLFCAFLIRAFAFLLVARTNPFFSSTLWNVTTLFHLKSR